LKWGVQEEGVWQTFEVGADRKRGCSRRIEVGADRRRGCSRRIEVGADRRKGCGGGQKEGGVVDD